MRRAAEVEREVGILSYTTLGEPCRARVKSTPEDFVVEELIAISGLTAAEASGYYPLYRIEKSRIDTLHMAEELSAALKSKVSYAGLKDKNASAVQYATPTSLRGLRPSTIERERFTAKVGGFVLAWQLAAAALFYSYRRKSRTGITRAAPSEPKLR